MKGCVNSGVLWLSIGLIGLLAPAVNAAGASLVSVGTITQVTNTSGNGPVFAVQVVGGINNTCLNQWIYFNQSDAPDLATFQRAYANALLALTTGIPVTIYNYSDASCGHASYIGLGQ